MGTEMGHEIGFEDSKGRESMVKDPLKEKRPALPLAPEEVIRALDVAPVGIVITDARAADNPVIFANHAFSAITGYGLEDLIGTNLRVLRGKDTNLQTIATMNAALAQGEGVACDLLNYRKSGEPFWMRADIRPILDETGHTSAFIAGLTDVTQVLDNENKRMAVEAKCRHDEAWLRAFTDAIPLPMLTVYPSGVIGRTNQAGADTLGVAPEDLPGHALDAFLLADEPESSEPGSSFWKTLRTHGVAHRLQVRARRADGEVLWFLASAREFVVEDEHKYVVVFQDVTRLKDKEQELIAANEEAERNIHARQRFLASISHDLRQPLQAMSLFAMVLENHVSTPQGKKVVRSLQASLCNMEEMFNSLLDMSKLEAGVMKAEPRIFQLSDIFELLETTYRPQAENAGLSMRVVPTSVTIRTDPRMLERILGNLVSNAIRYTPKGRILLGVRRHGGSVRLLVGDTGPGIPESQRLQIFREFQQGSAPVANGRSGGVGLGLSIVQRMTSLLGHAVSVHSVEGRGSLFSVEVPLVEDQRNFKDTAEDSPVEDTRMLGDATVVIIDDDWRIRDGLRELLESWQAHPIAAATGDEALRILNKEGRKPQAILADLHLRGGLGGVSIIHTLREKMGVEAPAWLFTGDTEAPEDIPGAGRVLRKPLNPATLRGLLADALGMK